MNRHNRITRWHGLTILLWLVALMLAGWTLAQLPLERIASQVGQLTGFSWLLWSTVNVVILYLAVQRWQVLGKALQTPLSLSLLFRLRQAGGAVSFLTPGPHFGGEPLQLYWLCRDCGTPLHRAVAMLGLDRFMEMGTNVAVLLAGVLMLLGTAIMPTHEWLQISAILTGVLCAMLCAVALVLRHPAWLARRFRPLIERFRGGAGAVRNEHHEGNRESGWHALVELLNGALSRHQPRLWLALMLSLLGWAALLLELVLLLHFLGLAPSPTDILLIMVGIRLAMLLPAPGGIGTIEASLLWSFQFLELPVSAAVGLIALMRLRDALVLMIGLGCLWSFQRPGASEPRAQPNDRR